MGPLSPLGLRALQTVLFYLEVMVTDVRKLVGREQMSQGMPPATLLSSVAGGIP